MTETLSHSTIEAKLAVLDADERLISSRRQALHRRIDALYLSAPLDTRQIAELDVLEEQEQEISAERHALHNKIGRLRGEISGSGT